MPFSSWTAGTDRIGVCNGSQEEEESREEEQEEGEEEGEEALVAEPAQAGACWEVTCHFLRYRPTEGFQRPQGRWNYSLQIRAVCAFRWFQYCSLNPRPTFQITAKFLGRPFLDVGVSDDRSRVARGLVDVASMSSPHRERSHFHHRSRSPSVRRARCGSGCESALRSSAPCLVRSAARTFKDSKIQRCMHGAHPHSPTDGDVAQLFALDALAFNRGSSR